ncbi:MAG: PAS domain S-box protein [Balneolales bacterium]|nr:PAS domain S-box protein [Balneolales bacterium]
MLVCDQVTLQVLDINRAGVDMIGLQKEEILKKTLRDLVQEVEPELAAEFKKLTHASSFERIWRLRTKKSSTIYVQFSSHLFTHLGNPAKIIIAHDVTKLVKGTTNSGAITSSPLGFQGFPLAEIEWKKNGEILRWSDKAEEMFGWNQEELIKDHHLLDNFVFHEDAEFVFGSLEEFFKTQTKTGSLINRNVTKDGDIVYSEWHNSILYDESGEVISIYSLVADVTDRVEALNRSERSMRSYEDLFNSISDAIYLLDENGEIIVANKGIELVYGYSLEEVIHKNQSFLRAPGKFNSNEVEEILNAKTSSSKKKVKGWSKKANGEVFPTEMLINKGQYFGEEVTIIVERDVSDQLFAQEELTRRDKLLGELFNASPLAIVLLNQHDEVELVNHGFEKIFGYRLDEIKGLELDRIIVPEEDLEEAKRLTRSPKVLIREVKRKTKNGQEINVIVYSVPVFIDNKMEAQYGIYLDITNRKKTEEFIKSSLREKEVLLAEIHHRVKNNLAVITGLLELQSYTTDDISARTVLKNSQMRVHSIALVHEKLYQNENLSDINVQSYIKELVHTISDAVDSNTKNISIDFDLDDINLIITQAIPCGLLINEIVTNSYKHAFNGQQIGTIKIKFKQNESDLVLSIKDNGVGLDQMNYSRPGPSLGMKLIRTLSKQLNSDTRVITDEGTEFSFRFRREQI